MEYRNQLDEKNLIVNSLAAEKDKLNLIYKKAINDNEKLKVVIEEK